MDSKTGYSIRRSDFLIAFDRLAKRTVGCLDLSSQQGNRPDLTFYIKMPEGSPLFLRRKAEALKSGVGAGVHSYSHHCGRGHPEWFRAQHVLHKWFMRSPQEASTWVCLIIFLGFVGGVPLVSP